MPSLIHTVDIFQTWRERFSDWETLRAFLESEEGGYLRITDESDTMCIIRYDKEHSLMDVAHVRWCRSVIWDKIHHCPVSVAPPKASMEECPYTEEEVDKVVNGEFIVEEYVDGFMIQVYQVKGDPTLHIATRSKRDASGTFYSAKTFRTLFLEAYGGNPVALEWDKGRDKEQQEQEQEQEQERETVARFWSYVVQHPEHRVVTPVTSPRLHLVHQGAVFSTGEVRLWSGYPSLSLLSALSDAPVTGETVGEWIARACQARPWSFRGVVIKDASGERWRFRSEKYMAIQSLRGGGPNVYERYARIFSQNLSAVYFEYYPEDMIPFSLCGVFVNDIVYTLYRIYHSLYIRKTTSLSLIHKVYRPHLYAIHGIYLSSLRPCQKWMTVHDIRLYLMNQPPSRISFLIRHHQEEYHSHIGA